MNEKKFNSQGVPHFVLFNGVELKRRFRDVPESNLSILGDIPNRGSILFDDERYSLMVFRIDNGVIVGLSDGSVKSKDENGVWCHYYRFLFIDENDHYTRGGEDYFCLQSQHPRELKRLFYPIGNYINVYDVRNHCAQRVKRQLCYDRPQNRTILVKNGCIHINTTTTIPFELVIHFDVKREDFVRYMELSIHKLCYLRQLLANDDVYYRICRDYSNIWRLPRIDTMAMH